MKQELIDKYFPHDVAGEESATAEEAEAGEPPADDELEEAGHGQTAAQ